MQTKSYEKPLRPYYYNQELRCTVCSMPSEDELNPPGVKYMVTLPDERRQCIISSDDPNLQPGTDLDVTFLSYFGKRLMFRHSSAPIKHEFTISEHEIKGMSLPVHGSLVTVTIVEKSADGYVAAFTDYWGDIIKNSIISSEALEIGESLDAVVSGWSANTVSFVSAQDIEKEIERQKERSKYLTGNELDRSSDELDLELDWMGALTSLTIHAEPENDTFQPMREHAEALIEKLKQDGLGKHWDATVEALGMFAFPKEKDEISNLLHHLVELHSEKEVIEFLTYRLHPDKECPLTPISKDILLALRSPSRAV